MKRVFSFILTAAMCLALGISASATGRLAVATNNAIVVSNSLDEPDAHLVHPAVYKIDGANYFRLRDIAMLLNGSGRQFSVDYNEGSVAITTGKRYAPNGSELSGAAASKNNAVFSKDPIIIDGTTVTLTAYKIDGANYFKLRDLGKALDFQVTYDNETKTVSISGARGYADQSGIAFTARYIRTNGYVDGERYPKSMWITSASELQDYHAANKEIYDLGGGFADTLEEYNESFFAGHNLILVVLEEPSGSIRHRVQGVQVSSNEQGRFAVQPVIERSVPEVGTADMAEWHILIAVGKEYGKANSDLAEVSFVSSGSKQGG